MQFPWWYWPVGVASLILTYLAICAVRVRPDKNAAGYLFDKPKWLWGPGWHLALGWPFTEVREYPSTMETVRVSVNVLSQEAQRGLRFDENGSIRRWHDLSNEERALALENPLEHRHPVDVDLVVWFEIPQAGIFNFVRHLGGSPDRAKTELADAARGVAREMLALCTVDTILAHGREVSEMILGALIAPQLGLASSKLSSVPPSWGLNIPKLRLENVRQDPKVAGAQTDFVAALSKKKTVVTLAEAETKKLLLKAGVMATPEGREAVLLDSTVQTFQNTEKLIAGPSVMGTMSTLKEVLHAIDSRS